MQQQQKRTFLPYLRGIPPEALRLGSLYINPLNPNDGLASGRFEFRSDLEQEDYEEHVKKARRIWKPEVDYPFSIDFEYSEAASLGFSLSDFVNVSGERGKSVLVNLQGDSGRRLKIRDPEAFLEEVMEQTGLEKWIRKHASIKYKSRFGRTQWNPPELWMVTGVQHVTGGEVHFEGGASRTISGEGGGDAGPAVGAPKGLLKAKAKASHEKSNGASNDFGHEDERIWAAQFMEIKIEFGREEDDALTLRTKDLAPKTIHQFRLEDVPDLRARGIRASQERAGPEATPLPKLIGRVTAQRLNVTTKPDDEDDKDPEGLIINDAPYVASIQNADWESYNAYRTYLSDVERNDRSGNAAAD